jgi:hypothetical protein
MTPDCDRQCTGRRAGQSASQSDNDRQKSVQYVNIQWEGPAIVNGKVVKIIDLADMYIQSNGIATKVLCLIKLHNTTYGGV